MSRGAYRWRGWRTDLKGGLITDRDPKLRSVTGGKQRGITNEQAKFLAKLQKRAGEPYSGRGMTAAQADETIKRLLASSRRRRA